MFLRPIVKNQLLLSSFHVFLPRNKAKIRSEVNAPFRTVRMFFSLAFIASASVGALISLPKLIASVGGAPNAASIDDTLVGLAIDLVAIAFFVFLYRLGLELCFNVMLLLNMILKSIKN